MAICQGEFDMICSVGVDLDSRDLANSPSQDMPFVMSEMPLISSVEEYFALISTELCKHDFSESLLLFSTYVYLIHL